MPGDERKAEQHNGIDSKIKIPTLQFFVISLVPYSGNLQLYSEQACARGEV
jgi:hypothetical protein